MTIQEKIETFASAAHSLFVIGNWKWGYTLAGEDMIPSELEIRSMCWNVLAVCEGELGLNPQKGYTMSSCGRITCNLVRGRTPQFTLDITPRQ